MSSSSDDETVEIRHTFTWDNTSMVLNNEEFERVCEQATLFEPLLSGGWSEVTRGDQDGVVRAMVGAIEQLCPEIRAGLLNDDEELRRTWCTYIFALEHNRHLPRGTECTIVSE